MQLQMNMSRISRIQAELFVQAYYAAALTALVLGVFQAPGALRLPARWAAAIARV